MIYSFSRKGNNLYNTIFFLILAYSLYTGFGGDNDRYREFVEGGYLVFFEKEYYALDPLYVYIAKVTKNFILWKLVVYGLSIYFTLCAIKKYKVENPLTLLSFVLLCMMTYGTSRCVLAYSAFVLGYAFLEEDSMRSKTFGVIFIISSYFAHSSMILPILLTPLCFFKLTEQRFHVLMLLFPIFVLFFNGVYELIFNSDFFENSISAKKFESYNAEERASQSSTMFSSFILFYFSFILLPLVYAGVKGICNRTLDAKFYNICKFSFYLTYVSLVMYFSDLNSELFFKRYYTMVPFYLYIAFSAITQTRGWSFSRVRLFFKVASIYIVLMFLYQIYNLYV